MTKFPNVTVQLTGNDGNAFFIMGAVTRTMRRSGCTKEDIDKYREDAMSGDYDNLLRITMETVNVE